MFLLSVTEQSAKDWTSSVMFGRFSIDHANPIGFCCAFGTHESLTKHWGYGTRLPETIAALRIETGSMALHLASCALKKPPNQR